MQIKLGKEHVLLVGNAGGDAELRTVGKEKTYYRCRVSLAVDNRDDETVWVQVEGWRKLALAMAGIRKGDPVMAIGSVRTDEYNGKTRKYLNAEWVGGAGGSKTESAPAAPEATEELKFEELADDDDELPF